MMNSSPGIFSCWQFGEKLRVTGLISFASGFGWNYFPLHTCTVHRSMGIQKYFFYVRTCSQFWVQKVKLYQDATDWDKRTKINASHQIQQFHQIPTCCCVWWRCSCGENTFVIVVIRREMAGAIPLLCFSELWASPNGICLKLNNSSIKRQVRNKKLNTEPFQIGELSWKMEFQLLEIKSPQQQMEV